MHRIPTKQLVLLACAAGLLAGALLSPGVAHALVPHLSGWDLAWNDEFDGTTVDGAAWEVLTRRDSFNNEKQYYLPEQVTVDNGRLSITANDVPLDGKLYRSGRLWTNEGWSYGRFEARAKLPATQGMWPAFWLVPRDSPWPTGGEIDIMENRGSEPTKTSSAYHWGESVAAHDHVSQQFRIRDASGNAINFHDSYHTYAAEWEPGVIRFYVDNLLHYTVTEQDGPILTTPKSVVLNLAVGGHFGGDPDATTVFPQSFDIDYVRVWERSDTPDIFLSNASFEGAGWGDIIGWSTFGNSAGNVNDSSEAVLDGAHSLRLSGRMTSQANWSGAYQGVSVQEGMELKATVASLSRGLDGLAGTGNTADMKIEFYSQHGAGQGSAQFISESVLRLADASSATDLWSDHELLATVPAGAVEARLTFIFQQPNQEAGAVFLDAVTFTVIAATLPGDYNSDGFVDAADYTVWRDTAGTTGDLRADGNGDGVVDLADYQFWKNNYGEASSSSSSTTPEPSALLLLGITVLLLASSSQRNPLRHAS